LGRLSFVSVGSNKPKREKKNIIIKSGSTWKVDLELGQPKALARFEVDKTRACNWLSETRTTCRVNLKIK
jgi:hypothetical protein